jgi:adenylate kinase family enzyme
MRLSELGERICILGPSNSGKSTLVEAIARKRGLKAIHLDQLHHLPSTDWKPRPEADFLAMHDEVIAGNQWVIDGNYSKCFPQRFQRATGVILLDISTVASLFRYVRRTVIGGARAGALEGGQDSLKMGMIHHLAVVTPRSRNRYADVYRQLDVPKVYLSSIRAIDACYRDWALER